MRTRNVVYGAWFSLMGDSPLAQILGIRAYCTIRNAHRTPGVVGGPSDDGQIVAATSRRVIWYHDAFGFFAGGRTGGDSGRSEQDAYRRRRVAIVRSSRFMDVPAEGRWGVRYGRMGTGATPQTAAVQGEAAAWDEESFPGVEAEPPLMHVP